MTNKTTKPEKTEETELPDELVEALWGSLGKFVRKCGGDMNKATDEDRAELGDELAAWALLVSESEDG